MSTSLTNRASLRRTIILVLAIVAGASFVINVLALVGPIYMIQIYDRVLSSHSLPTLVGLSVIVFALFGFMTVLDVLRSRILTRFGHHFDLTLTETVYRRAVAPVRAGDHSPIQDLDRVRQFALSPGLPALFDMPWIPVYLGVVFLFHSELGWIATIGAIVIALCMVGNELTSRTPLKGAEEALARRNNAFRTDLTNAEALTAMGMLGALQARWATLNSEFLARQRTSNDRTGFFSALIKGARPSLQAAILGYGAWLVIRQEISPGLMIAASIVGSRALAPVEQAVNHWRNFISTRASVARLRALVNEPPESERLALPLPSKSLTVSNLFVLPPRGDKPVVQDISFELVAGDGLGIVGPSGSGKSSLARALVGVWPAARGKVELDGHDLSHWAPERRGRMVGYVPQDTRLLDGTIAQNIARFEPNPRAEDVLAAARLVGVHDLITQLPQGYDTPLGENGTSFSAGQRQRIALARAFYRTPFFIVLDEPNSDLDVEGERALVEAVKTMRQRGSIIVFVSHRQSALAAVNKLIILDKGRIAKAGPRQAAQATNVTPIADKRS